MKIIGYLALSAALIGSYVLGGITGISLMVAFIAALFLWGRK